MLKPKTEGASVAVTRYKEPNAVFAETLCRLAGQEMVNLEVLVLDQQDDAEIRALSEELTQKGPHNFSYQVINARGISYARNQAIERSRHDLLLFVDTDHWADSLWAYWLMDALEDSGAGIAGARIEPLWTKRPLLAAKANLVRELYSLYEKGLGRHAVGKIIGTYGFRKSRLGETAHFDQRIGRNGNMRGGEETDLCRRILEKELGVVYEGRAQVRHVIQAERISYRWVAMRLYNQGLDRSEKGGAPAPSHRLSLADYLFAPFILSCFGAGWLRSRMAAQLG